MDKFQDHYWPNVVESALGGSYRTQVTLDDLTFAIERHWAQLVPNFSDWFTVDFPYLESTFGDGDDVYSKNEVLDSYLEFNYSEWVAAYSDAIDGWVAPSKYS